MHSLVLATDLDGTFLEGPFQVKKDLYPKLFHLRDNIMLIYVTGRPVESVQELCLSRQLPPAHYVIGDHGTHIVEGTHFKPISNLQESIIKKWNNGTPFLKKLLQKEPGIQLQPLNPPYRLAYYYAPHLLKNETLDKITQAGFDYVLSSEQYLDILPKGVGKGTSLLNLLSEIRISSARVITSGDSLNDLSLFETGLKSIAVSNSEPKLIDKIKSLPNVFFSSFPGILGVLDGLRHWKAIDLDYLSSKRQPAKTSGSDIPM